MDIILQQKKKKLKNTICFPFYPSPISSTSDACTNVVATAITLESVGLLSAAMADFASAEAVCVTVARDKKAGPYHLMMGQNPVYIFTFQN